MSSFSYSVPYTRARPALGRVSTSRTELLHLGIAFVVLAFDLSVLFSAGSILTGAGGFYTWTLPIVATAATAALTGFVAHELAHKIAAQRRGYWAEFRMSPIWLLFSVFTAFLGLLWAAPGATVVSGMSDPREWGRTSLAGPTTNFVFGASFYAGAVVTYFVAGEFTPFLLLLAYINGWFAAFNLIPFGPLDGRKVWNWNRGIWVASFAIAAALALVSFLAFYVFGTPILFH